MAPGDAAAIMGPSGSGKSSLLYILGGSSRHVRHRHARRPQPVPAERGRLAAFRNKEIGFVFQDHCLLPQCTVLENVLDSDAGRAEAARRRERARAVDRAGRPRRSHRSSPGELSGGERQRVAIARALVRGPRCCSATSRPATSIARRRQRRAVLLDLHRCKQTILVVVTHSAQLAEKLPRRAIELQRRARCTARTRGRRAERGDP
jgi:lipoprotein-releasing system ATP-binding protein